MKFLTLLLFAALSVHGAEDFRMFWWQESLDKKTGEKLSACYLAPGAVKAVYEAMAKGDEKAAAALAEKLPPDARSSNIRGSSSSGKSLMPEGLESGLSVQAMADLLSFIEELK